MSGPVAVTTTSTDLAQAMSPQPPIPLGGDVPDGPEVVTVDDTRTFQRMLGFGATFTDSSAWLVQKKLSPPARDELMDRLFGPGGARLGFLRQPMGATDFIAVPKDYFTYDDRPLDRPDPALEHFSVHHDVDYVLPTLRHALRVNPGILVMLTAWSAPAWMKTNGRVVEGGSLDPRYYPTWAEYYARSLAAYTAAGVPIWATSAQNEPTVTQTYPSMTWEPGQQADFVRNHLQPALAAHGLPAIVLAGVSAQFETDYVGAVLTDPANPVAGIVGGISEHGYRGDPEKLGELHDLFPALPIYQTELSPGCQPRTPPLSVIELGIRATRNWARTVTAWNVALDERGGPHHLGGGSRCVGLVTVDSTTGAVRYNLPYYQEAQFSAFVDRDADRVASTVPDGAPLHNVAFRNPDGTLVLVVHNTDEERAHPLTVRWRATAFTTSVPAGTSATYRWR